MKYLLTALAALTLLTCAAYGKAEQGEPKAPVAAYLLPGAPVFNISISDFRERFNHDNPTLQLNEFRAIEVNDPKVLLLRAATKINENLYASAALERATLKIKSIQITWLPIQGPEQANARAKALAWMKALINHFNPNYSAQQSANLLTKLLSAGKNKSYYAQTEGALRYVVADDGEKGLTFAVEPVKLVLSEALENSNQ
ncbi:hypothetical protein A9B99_19405 [Mangrovibacter phragmitis]|uniref:DUF1454 domain-containing protein n=1 Tax=Mangrovibacter phragmitis TaxID=1691903 RepID=A0A1B7L654_9ENTR|nr:DUF1454 family protein [Mangrovibacter phragmitis]OAT77813.1 hypothetical protein A9B99_19405 [Mangrovibacter phragmitis]